MSAIKVEHAGRHHRFLGTAVIDGENAPISVGEDHCNHVRHFRSAHANRPEKGDLFNDNKCGAYLDELRRTRYSQSFKEKAEDVPNSDIIELISNAFGLEVKGCIAKKLRLDGLKVSVKVMFQFFGQLAKVSHQAFIRPCRRVKTHATANQMRGSSHRGRKPLAHGGP